MQRFFSTFPSGRPGVGLLILRLAIGVSTASAGVLSVARAPVPGIEASIGAITAVASGLSLVTGFLTPVSGVVVVIQALALALGGVPEGLPVDGWRRLEPLLFVAVALAGLLLGPGAYSVDAILFGRREIVIAPPRRGPGR